MITAVVMMSALALQVPASIPGPLTVCLPHSQFRLTTGEAIRDVSVGVHGVALTISGPTGSYRVSENEIVRTPADLGIPVRRERGVTLYRANGGGYRFTVADPDREREQMLVMLDGAALSGSARDADIYDRVTVGPPPSEGCGVRYVYGFSLLAR
ncbi:hypothetical protein [Brevundimonas sp.]